MQVTVLGAYLPRLDQKGLSGFIRSRVESFKQTLYEMNRTTSIWRAPEEIEARALELPHELERELQRCALFEIEVTGNDSDFDASNLHDPESDQCGWEPAFLTIDGTSVINEMYVAPPSLRDFRVAFYIHDWLPSGRLVGPVGELALPQFASVPERLWKLAPYSLVD